MEEDVELVQRFKRGDESAFDSLVKRHYQRVCNILSHTIGAASSVEDLAQEVFLKTYYALRNYRGESAFSTWLYRVAVNVGLDELRREKRRRVFSFLLRDQVEGAELENRIPAVQGQSAERELEEKELGEILQGALKRIPEKHRVVFVLREIEGFPYVEIAEMLGCSIGTIKSRLFHARLKLRQQLRPYLKEYDR